MSARGRPLPTPAAPLTALEGLRYGAIGAPLAFAALPLYVLLPSHYGATLGVPLAALGAVLLATRALDALIDPWLGRIIDQQFARRSARPMALAGAAALLLGGGLAALFLPPVSGAYALLAWCALALVITCLGYSTLGVLHQAWGARLGGDGPAQARVMGWREGAALIGVLTASVLPGLAGLVPMVVTCALGLALGLWALRHAPCRAGPDAPAAAATVDRLRPVHLSASAGADNLAPWAQPAFRRLMAVFVLNGVASAIPATLVIFFIRDRLQAATFEPLFLGGYFLAAALSMPLWVRVTHRIGLAAAWGAGMGLAVASFIWASLLGPGDVLAFTLVCLASGAALGADLIAPAAMLTGVIQRAGHAQRLEGRYAGWWACATKLNLALAAGAALPALQLMGYRPGSSEPEALRALALCYAVLPCLLKVGAAATLWRLAPSILEERYK